VLSHLLPMSRRREDRSNVTLTAPKTHADKLSQPKGVLD
jgi:acetyl-CoA carboxylase carboxyl transferase subunit beta